MTEAKHTPGPPQVSDPTPRWWWCDTHGPGTNAAWGCPECVREMRAEIAALRKDAERYRWLRRADVDVDGCVLIYAEQALDDAVDADMGGKA